jgi:hypothetical protein
MFFIFGPLWFVILASVIWLCFNGSPSTKTFVKCFLLGVGGILAFIVLWLVLLLNGHEVKPTASDDRFNQGVGQALRDAEAKRINTRAEPQTKGPKLYPFIVRNESCKESSCVAFHEVMLTKAEFDKATKAKKARNAKIKRNTNEIDDAVNEVMDEISWAAVHR